LSVLLNRPRALEIFGPAGVEAIVGTTHANVRYLSGFAGFGQRLMPVTQVYAVARLEALEEPALVLPAGELDMISQFPVEGVRLLPYGRFVVQAPPDGVALDGELSRYAKLSGAAAAGTALDALVAELDSHGREGLVALDERGIAPAVRDALRARYGKRILDGAALIDQVRMLKTPEEVRRLARATEAIEAAYEEALRNAHAGMTEFEMALVMDCETMKLGCEPVFTVIGFGERSALPNAIPSNRRLRPGDIVRFDIGCRADGYYSDIARTAIFGTASNKQREYYDAILEGEERAIEQVRAGVPANQIFDTAVETTRKAGIPHYDRHHVGHGIGLDLYDLPLLNRSTVTPLEAGMVLEVETPYYEVGFGGLQVEDTVVVTAYGCERLTRTSSKLVVVV
jgi:Xaa-Pro dipeptidase